MAYLRHLFNGTTVTIYELRDAITIGRHPNCQIRVDDPTVSGHHASLSPEDEGWFLQDVGSTNGVLVKSKKVDRLLMEPGCLFEIGTHEFEFFDELPNDLGRTLKIKKSWIPGVYYTE
ncbi:FHA domain-containing protein [Teredinibacter sp. KSP-S5-2]|uniref:FHA domain-containing protein n=1 Tax=Teredinibacter sp. KSP-S5-2 TaxID=3034506 RepID=UPI0029345F43|nr:FHA domain-containing protein [Teredinibacter sp. KSP-S5-2]WNO09891.1 FHA domain-containing protein [Teredinibacter sp. KSP-S5-2]